MKWGRSNIDFDLQWNVIKGIGFLVLAGLVGRNSFHLIGYDHLVLSGINSLVALMFFLFSIDEFIKHFKGDNYGKR